MLALLTAAACATGCPGNRLPEGGQEALAISRLDVELDVHDTKGKALRLDLSPAQILRAELGKAAHLRLVDGGSAGAGSTTEGARLRVHARLAPDRTTQELVALVSGRIDRTGLVPLGWDVDLRRPVKLSDPDATIDEQAYADQLQQSLGALVTILDRQVVVAARPLPELMTTLTNADPPGRLVAARVLGLKRHEPALQPLCKALAATEKRTVEEALLEALAKLADQRAVPCLRSWAGDDSRRLELAVGTTTRIGGREGRAFLEEVAASPKAGARAKGLARAGVAEVRGDRAHKLSSHDHEEEEHDEGPQAMIFKALRHDDQQVRVGAARQLGMTGNADAVEPLCRALDHEDPVTVENALEALVQLGSQRAVPCLVRWSAADERRTPIVIEGLARLGGREARSVLELLARDHASDQIRQLARAGVQRIDGAATGATPAP